MIAVVLKITRLLIETKQHDFLISSLPIAIVLRFSLVVIEGRVSSTCNTGASYNLEVSLNPYSEMSLFSI